MEVNSAVLAAAASLGFPVAGCWLSGPPVAPAASHASGLLALEVPGNEFPVIFFYCIIFRSGFAYVVSELVGIVSKVIRLCRSR